MTVYTWDGSAEAHYQAIGVLVHSFREGGKVSGTSQEAHHYAHCVVCASEVEVLSHMESGDCVFARVIDLTQDCLPAVVKRIEIHVAQCAHCQV